QELVNNIQKHASSTNVFVSLIDHGDALNLTIEDDGVGFNVKEETKGIGLKNVRSRVKMLGGEIHVESSENAGSLINIEVPKHQ
ncbi:MAG: ATP-binding protein, partial [Flavobacteriales bacterium]|nr:ATP-binding protein [Flavobacteriales bacterium]